MGPEYTASVVTHENDFRLVIGRTDDGWANSVGTAVRTESPWIDHNVWTDRDVWTDHEVWTDHDVWFEPNT